MNSSVLMGLVVALTLVLPGRREVIAALLIYCFLVFSSTVMIRVGGIDDPLKYVAPFTEYRAAFSTDGFKYDIVENVLLFVPAGVLMGVIDGWKRRWLPIVCLSLFIVSIEVLQRILQVGYSEFDDG